MKAVEAVACPLVSPNNNRATLGTVKRDLTNQANNWELALCGSDGKLSGVDRLIRMVALLWEGQSRHAGSPNSRRQTQTEAEAAQGACWRAAILMDYARFVLVLQSGPWQLLMSM